MVHIFRQMYKFSDIQYDGEYVLSCLCLQNNKTGNKKDGLQKKRQKAWDENP